MSNEQQELLNEGYLNHIRTIRKESVQPLLDRGWCVEPNYPTKKEFIDKCKTNPDFSEKWGLKIEERELSLEERKQIVKNKYFQEFYWKIVDDDNDVVTIFEMDKRNIPTKLITITYNDKTIESYG